MTGAAMRHCWRCGARLDAPPPTVCARCGQDHFNNPKPAAEAVVTRDRQVLLIRRAHEPWRDHWDIPGGFCDPGEHPMRTAERELSEETGIRGRATTLIGLWIDDYGPPAADGLQETTLNVAYLVEPLGGAAAATDGEASDIAWFPLDAVPGRLAFPAHAAAVLDAARRLLGDDA